MASKAIKIPLGSSSFFSSAKGLKEINKIVRKYRLWEVYLCDTMKVCAEDVHLSAHKPEHVTDISMQNQLEQEAGHPGIDPHQREIPGRE